VTLREKVITPLEMETPTVSCEVEAETSVVTPRSSPKTMRRESFLGEEVEEGVARVDAAVEHGDGPRGEPHARGVGELGAEHRVAGGSSRESRPRRARRDVARDEGEHRAPPALEADGLLDGELELVARLAGWVVSRAAWPRGSGRRGAGRPAAP
jgi:hypothetical protein